MGEFMGWGSQAHHWQPASAATKAHTRTPSQTPCPLLWRLLPCSPGCIPPPPPQVARLEGEVAERTADVDSLMEQLSSGGGGGWGGGGEGGYLQVSDWGVEQLNSGQVRRS